MAYLYLKKGKFNSAIKLAEDSVLLNPDDYRNYYVLGYSYFKIEKNAEAIEWIDKLIEIKPNYAEAYFLKNKALKLPSDVETDSKEAKEFYKKKRSYFIKFLTMVAESPDSNYWKNQRKSVKFFADYYKKQENLNEDDEEDENKIGIKILSKPKPSYTDPARQASISGTIRVLTAFLADGKVGATLVIEGLGYGLNEEATRAARSISFEPEMKDGKPVTVVRIVQYSFRI